jgi:hypothetical protein
MRRSLFLHLKAVDAVGSVEPLFVVVVTCLIVCIGLAFGTVQNVVQIDRSGKPELGRCFMPEGNLVAGDCMLAQKIAIENCEEEVLRTSLPFQVLKANRFR